MEQSELANWDSDLIEEAIRAAEDRLKAEKEVARKRAVQLAREQAYHRLALEIDRPRPTTVGAGQLSFFPTDPTLFEDP